MFGKKKTVIPMRLHKIDEEGYHLSVIAIINGKTARLIVDPGASRTVFDEAQTKEYINYDNAQVINRKTTGVGKEEIEAKRIELDTLQLGELITDNYKAAAVDLSHINAHYKHLHFPSIQGLLGGDLLQDMNAIIDYKKLTLTLRP